MRLSFGDHTVISEYGPTNLKINVCSYFLWIFRKTPFRLPPSTPHPAQNNCWPQHTTLRNKRGRYLGMFFLYYDRVAPSWIKCWGQQTSLSLLFCNLQKRRRHFRNRNPSCKCVCVCVSVSTCLSVLPYIPAPKHLSLSYLVFD